MTELQQIQVAHTCYAIVFGRFADMCNPFKRGRLFSWEDFAETIADRCECELHLYMDVPDSEDGEAMRAFAKKTAFEIATNMVDRAGFISASE